MTGLALRAVRPGDDELLLDLFAASAPGRDLLPAPLLVMQEQAQRAQWTDRWGAGGHAVVERDGLPVARLWVGRAADRWRLVDLSVTPSCRRTGVGRALLTGLCQAADALGVPVELHVDLANAPARSLYDTLGFAPVSADELRQLRHRPPRSLPP